jgi:hypothetical protein
LGATEQLKALQSMQQWVKGVIDTASASLITMGFSDKYKHLLLLFLHHR